MLFTDVFHWWCLDSWARSLPSDTAPAGYTCPCCRMPLFPAPNLVSPVADVLKEKLAGVNWARTGLGLPLLTEDVGSKPLRTVFAQNDSNLITPKSISPPPPSASPHSIVHMPEVDKTAAFNRNEMSAPRRTTHQPQVQENPVLFDHDENKYKRRPPGEWILRKWK